MRRPGASYDAPNRDWARAVLYLRVSTLDQTTANQEHELRDLAGRMGCNIVHIYKDHGIGGAIRDDIIYVADSQSDEKTHPPFRQGIRIGSVKDGKVTAFIPQMDPKLAMPEGLAADKNGNVFGGFATDMDFKKFAKN